MNFAAKACDDSFLCLYPFSSILSSQESKDWKGSWLLGRQPQVHGWDNNDDDDDDDDNDDGDDNDHDHKKMCSPLAIIFTWHLAIMQGTAFRGWLRKTFLQFIQHRCLKIYIWKQFFFHFHFNLYFKQFCFSGPLPLNQRTVTPYGDAPYFQYWQRRQL